MTPVELISPGDGRVFAERLPLRRDAAFATVATARAAQQSRAARRLSRRSALVKAGVARLIEAQNLMNDSPYGLTASVWTKDPEPAAALGTKIETGTVFMNRADSLDPAPCRTARKNTGRGGSLSCLGSHSVTRVKSCHLKKVTK